MSDDCEDKILNAYNQTQEAGVITFALKRNDCTMSYSLKKMKLGLKEILKTSSLQVSFSRMRVYTAKSVHAENKQCWQT